MSFLDSFQKLWKTWDLRSFLLFSFSLQCILILTASMRKRTSNQIWISLIWLAYLSADWSAYYAIGLIPSPRTSACEYDKYSDLHAFWAPFLLLHIGGPTTISAFSLEDNETWRRSVLRLVTEAGLTLFVIYRAIIPHYRNQLLAPTLLMFVAAFTRYLGRVLALYYASMDKFRNMDNKCDVDGGFHEHSSEVETVKDSYALFQTCKLAFTDYPTTWDSVKGKYYLLEVLEADEAFKVMEIQANLAYDIFYTKTWLILEKKVGSILHVVSLCSELVALVLWVLVDKQRFLPVDVRLTKTLVLGGIVVDVLSCFKLIFSDAMIPKLSKLKWVGDSCILNKALMLKCDKFWSRWLMINRWSGTIPQLNRIQVKQHRQKGMNWAMMSVVNYLIHPIQSVKLSKDVKERVRSNIKNARLNRFNSDVEKNFSYTVAGAEQRVTDYKAAIQDATHLDFFMNKDHMWEDLESILKSAQLVDSVFLFHIATNLLCNEDLGYRTDVAKQVSEYLLYYLFDGNISIAAQRMIEALGILMERDESGIRITTEAVSKCRLMIVHADNIKSHLMGLEKEDATAIIEDMWVGLLCSTAIQSSGRAHLERLSKGGEFLTMVWLLLTNVGLNTKNITSVSYDQFPTQSQSGLCDTEVPETLTSSVARDPA